VTGEGGQVRSEEEGGGERIRDPKPMSPSQLASRRWRRWTWTKQEHHKESKGGGVLAYSASSIDASITPPPLLNSLARRLELEEELTRTACSRGLFGEGGREG